MASGNKDIRIGKLKLEESNHLETYQDQCLISNYL